MSSRLSWPAIARGGLLSMVTALACIASSLPKLSVEDLVSQSEVIVSGTVTRTWTGWDSEHRFIWTHSELRVEGVIKGAPNRVITISEPGGSADGVAMQVPGATPYFVGEHVAVFLHRTPLTYLRTTGSVQGKLVLSKDGRLHSESEEKLDGLSLEQLRNRVTQVSGKQVNAK